MPELRLHGASLAAAACVLFVGSTHRIQAQTGIIYACINANNGTAVHIVAADEPCPDNHLRVQWNVAGPPGPSGPS